MARRKKAAQAINENEEVQAHTPSKARGTDVNLDLQVATVSGGVGSDRPVATSITYRDIDAALDSDLNAAYNAAADNLMSATSAAALLRDVRKARKLMASDRFRLAYQGLREGFLVHNFNLGVSATDTILGMPSVGRDAAAAKLRTAASLLATGAEGNVSETEGSLPGRQSFATCLSEVDYSRLQQTVNLPIGDLATLRTHQRDKITTYLRLVLQRMSNMANISDADEDEVIGGILSSVTRDWSHVTDDLRRLGIDITPDAFRENSEEGVRLLLTQLRDVDEYARRRFVSMTILQPLYRDVLLSRPEFSWPDADDVMRMARAHAGWKRMKNEGVIATFIQGDISRVVSADTKVSGFATLREATFLGVKQNAFIGLTALTEAVGVDAGYKYQMASDESAVAFGDDFVSVERTVVQRDVLDQPVVMHDRLAVNDISDTATRDELIIAIRALAVLSGVDILNSISLDFITTFPDWAGIVSPDLPANVGRAGGLLQLPTWVRNRLAHEFMCAVLNGEYADTSISGLFAEQNNADLQKVFEAGAYYYGVALTVVTRLLRQYLTAAKRSFEWADSGVWSELQMMNIMVDENFVQPFKTTYVTRFVNGPIAISTGTVGVKATRYYLDEEALVLTPTSLRLVNTLRALKCVGAMQTTVRRTRPFIVPNTGPIDIAEVATSDVLTQTMKKEILATSFRMSASEINGLVMSTRRDFQAVVYDKVVSPNGLLTDGFAFLGKIQPTIEVFFDHIGRVDQLPVSFLKTNPEVDGPLNDSNSQYQFGQVLRLVDPSIAVRVTNEAFDLSGFGINVYLPQSDSELRVSVERWQSANFNVIPADDEDASPSN